MNKLTQYSIQGMLALTSLPIVRAAAQQIEDIPVGPVEPLDSANLTESIRDIIGLIVNILLGIAGALAAAYLIYAGITYIQGGKGVDTARQSIINAITGIIIILLAYVIINTVIGIF